MRKVVAVTAVAAVEIVRRVVGGVLASGGHGCMRRFCVVTMMIVITPGVTLSLSISQVDEVVVCCASLCVGCCVCAHV